MFITCCGVASATDQLHFLKRVVHHSVFQHVSSILPTPSTSFKFHLGCLSMAPTLPASNRSRGAVGFIFSVSPHVCV